MAEEVCKVFFFFFLSPLSGIKCCEFGFFPLNFTSQGHVWTFHFNTRKHLLNKCKARCLSFLFYSFPRSLTGLIQSWLHLTFNGIGSGPGEVPLKPWKGSRCWFPRGGHAPSRVRGPSGAGPETLSCRQFRFSVSREQASQQEVVRLPERSVSTRVPVLLLRNPDLADPHPLSPTAYYLPSFPLVRDGNGKWRRCPISSFSSSASPDPLFCTRPRASRAAGPSAPGGGTRGQRPGAAGHGRAGARSRGEGAGAPSGQCGGLGSGGGACGACACPRPLWCPHPCPQDWGGPPGVRESGPGRRRTQGAAVETGVAGDGWFAGG